MISDDNRRVLFTQCAGHKVAFCWRCDNWWQPRELLTDLFRDRRPVCRQCREDLTESVEQHLLICEAIQRSHELMKQSHELSDAAHLQIAESHERLQRIRYGVWGPRPASPVGRLCDALLDVPKGQCATCIAATTGIGAEQMDLLIQRLGRLVTLVSKDGVCQRCLDRRRLFALR